MISAISTVFSGLTSFFKSFNINKYISTAIQSVVKFLKDIVSNVLEFLKKFLLKPTRKEDYVKVGQRYFSKRFIAMLTTGLIVGAVFVTSYAYPWADGRLWTASVVYNSSKYQKFSGKAKVYDNGHLIYVGTMAEGKITGHGKQYNESGNLVYEGDFILGEYSGTGQLYNNDKMIYEGSFLKNLYEGAGKIYNSDGQLIYSGSFVGGQKSGEGIEYDPKTKFKIYSGQFANDMREGKGTLYESDGSTQLYTGNFVAGLYEGDGQLNENGKLKYKGAFKSGLYEGEGTLYDVSMGTIIYQGAFVAGKYEGQGTLYDSTLQKMIYKGEFIAGEKKGKGESYDKFGATVFNGEFSDNTIAYLQYFGKTYDDISKEFGKESYKATVNNVMIVTYLSKNVSAVFDKDLEKNAYVCNKIILRSQAGFKGITQNSTQDEITKIMGQPYSSIQYKFDLYYNTVFSNLSVNLNSNNTAPSDKFIMDNYFIRLYYNQDKTKVLAIELCRM